MTRQFSEPSVSRISTAVRWAEEHYGDKRQQTRRDFLPVYRFLIGKTDGSGITARVGTTPGSGTVTIQTIDTDGPTLSALQSNATTPADVTKTVYNLSDTAVAATSYVMIMQEGVKGTFWAVWEDC